MPSALTLICLPCAGASATMYLRWRRSLPAHIQLVAHELPGRGSRIDEAPLNNYSDLVDLLVRELQPQLQGNYALFGHSMGAILSYGMCKKLVQQGFAALPRALFVSASAAPTQRDPARFAGLGDDAALIADLKLQGGTPAEVFEHPELLRMTLDVLAADYRVCDDFDRANSSLHPCSNQTHTPALKLPIHILAGRDDSISELQLRAWAKETVAKTSLTWFSGGHFYLRQSEVDALAVLVQQCTLLEQSYAAFA